jgi:nitrite reductase/ring-hydroxylating ferredoxin subunit
MAAWVELGPLTGLPDGRGTRHMVGTEQVLVVRLGDEVFALGNRCPHQGAPLDRGAVRAASPSSVTCPAHGSMFQLADGRVLRGPATSPLPRYDVRVAKGLVSIRSAEDGAPPSKG